MEKFDVITVLLDEGDRVYIQDTNGRKSWINSSPIQLNELVTFSEDSRQDLPIVRKAYAGEIAFGYLLTKDQVRSSDELILAKIVLLGQLFRLPAEEDIEIGVCDELFINNNGLVDVNDSGRDLKLISTHNKSVNDLNRFVVCFRQIGDVYICSESKFCLDLNNAYFTQNNYTGEIFLNYEPGSILEQCEFIEDKNGDTRMIIPDIAILDTIVYNETELGNNEEYWARKIDMSFDCTRGEE